MQSQIEQIKKTILPILQKHDIQKAGLFGSHARGDFSENSNIDILVEINKNISLLDFVGIKLDIEDALGKKVDLFEYNSIKPALRTHILNEQIRII